MPASATKPAEAQAITPALVADWLRIFIAPGQVTELRALGVSMPWFKRAHTVSGFYDFDALDAMAEQALALSEHAGGVYFIPNPLHPALLARRYRRVDHGVAEGDTASDKHVVARRWMLVDCDPVRPVSGISATDEEKAAARQVARGIWAALEWDGWPAPVVADSGNGFHLMYPLDGLPVDDGGAIQAVLQGLDREHSTAAVKVDTSVYNPARLVKLYGTWARKGDSIPERPHRESRILVVPSWYQQ